MEQSIGALLNLAVSDELREEMGKRGTVKMMMGKTGGLSKIGDWLSPKVREAIILTNGCGLKLALVLEVSWM